MGKIAKHQIKAIPVFREELIFNTNQYCRVQAKKSQNFQNAIFLYISHQAFHLVSKNFNQKIVVKYFLKSNSVHR